MKETERLAQLSLLIRFLLLGLLLRLYHCNISTVFSFMLINFIMINNQILSSPPPLKIFLVHGTCVGAYEGKARNVSRVK